MATYAIGDIHGCFEEFQILLEAIEFDATVDHIWHVGDLVNGGPDSLGALRWFIENEASATTVLGNHDLHLIAVGRGVQKRRENDTFGDVLEADDAPALIDWLRRRPLMVRRGERVLVHAGLLPQWSVDDACELAEEIEAVLSSSEPEKILSAMYGNQPRRIGDAKTDEQRWRCVINAMTRMRVLDADGGLNFSYKSTYDEIPEGKYAWFDAGQRAWADHQLFCGHWSALGLYHSDDVVALDTGCRWGGKLTAFRLEDEQKFFVDSLQKPVF